MGERSAAASVTSQVGLVQGHGLDHRGDVAEDVHDLAGHLAVAVEAGPHDDAVGTLAHGGGHGHGRVDAEPPRLVGRRGHHAAALGPAAHQHGQPAQLGVIQLLHGGVEGVQVGVDDVAEGWGHGLGKKAADILRDKAKSTGRSSLPKANLGILDPPSRCGKLTEALRADTLGIRPTGELMEDPWQPQY